MFGTLPSAHGYKMNEKPIASNCVMTAPTAAVPVVAGHNGNRLFVTAMVLSRVAR